MKLIIHTIICIILRALIAPPLRDIWFVSQSKREDFCDHLTTTSQYCLVIEKNLTLVSVLHYTHPVDRCPMYRRCRECLQNHTCGLAASANPPKMAFVCPKHHWKRDAVTRMMHLNSYAEMMNEKFREISKTTQKENCRSDQYSLRGYVYSFEIDFQDPCVGFSSIPHGSCCYFRFLRTLVF